MRPRTVLLMCAMVLLTASSGCSLLTNTNPPSYVKAITAYKEGSDGLMIYFILADSSGQMTTADGEATISISENTMNMYTGATGETPLWKHTFTVSKNEFVKTKIGQGAFERDALLMPIGRVTYHSFDKWPSSPLRAGKIRLEFKTTDGVVLNGEDSVLFL